MFFCYKNISIYKSKFHNDFVSDIMNILLILLFSLVLGVSKSFGADG